MRASEDAELSFLSDETAKMIKENKILRSSANNSQINVHLFRTLRQWEHSNGFSPVCTDICSLKFDPDLKTWRQEGWKGENKRMKYNALLLPCYKCDIVWWPFVLQDAEASGVSLSSLYPSASTGCVRRGYFYDEISVRTAIKYWLKNGMEKIKNYWPYHKMSIGVVSLLCEWVDDF